MAYEFVCESEAKRYRSDCSDVLKETCELLKEKGISAQFSLVGSGARKLKDTIRNALNKAVGGKFFSDAQDSTSCLTALLHFKDTPSADELKKSGLWQEV